MRETMLRIIGITLAGAIGCAGCASGPPPRDVDVSVRAAQLTFAKVQEDSGKAALHDSLARAKAILIVSPGISRAVALARSDGTQGWSGPAFYNVTMLDAMGGPVGGAGLSAGQQSLELVALAMSDKALAWFMAPPLPATSDMAVYTATGASGYAGRGADEADMLVFATQEGARGVARFGSPLISIDKAANQSYYGRPVTPADILVTQSVSNPSAAPLQKAVAAAE